MKQEVGIVILAAGQSSRLGQPKQIVCICGKSLLKRITEAAVESAASDVTVVVGYQSEIVRGEIDHLSVRVVKNDNWPSGMASSVCCGLADLKKRHPSLDAVLFLTCDQPFVTTAVIDMLICKYETTGRTIVASQYEQRVGVPALFDKCLFPELLQLTGESGAKPIIDNHIDDVATIDFINGSIDIDCAQDLDKIRCHFEESKTERTSLLSRSK